MIILISLNYCKHDRHNDKFYMMDKFLIIYDDYIFSRAFLTELRTEPCLIFCRKVPHGPDILETSAGEADISTGDDDKAGNHL